jgi:predicted O-methyltransferase YrrM
LISKNFREKLTHNFHELTPFEMLTYMIFIRPFWSNERRFFFEAELRLLGQMYSKERETIYRTILEAKPQHCFEIGTYTGGGSTFYIAKAFADIRKGKLFSSEISPYYYEKAKNYYSKHRPDLFADIEFLLGGEPTIFMPEIERAGSVDCILLDGAENGTQTLEQYRFFTPHFKKGTIMMLHDWNTEKTALVKPVIMADEHWKKMVELTAPESVGQAIFRFEP